jgi:hypothetical protein
MERLASIISGKVDHPATILPRLVTRELFKKLGNSGKKGSRAVASIC